MRIVKSGFSDAIFAWKGDGVGTHALLSRAGHHCDDAGRIQARAEKSANGNVADGLRFDRLAKPFANFHGKIRFRSRIFRFGGWKAEIPVLPNLQFAIPESGAVPGGKLVDSAKHCLRIWNPQKGQILM